MVFCWGGAETTYLLFTPLIFPSGGGEDGNFQHSVFTGILGALLNTSSGLIRPALSVCSELQVSRKTFLIPTSSAGGKAQPPPGPGELNPKRRQLVWYL